MLEIPIAWVIKNMEGFMGTKLLWAGLTLIQSGQFFNLDPLTQKVGAAVMIIGVILLFLDK